MGLAEDELREIEERWFTEEGQNALEESGASGADVMVAAETDIRALLAEVRRLQAESRG